MREIAVQFPFRYPCGCIPYLVTEGGRLTIVTALCWSHSGTHSTPCGFEVPA